MRAFLALFRKDLKSFFDQPTGYILLVIFVVSMAVVEFYSFPSVISANGILASNEASIFPMMALAPWILLFIVPVATMRLLAEELRDGTLEILLTQPLRMWTVIMSKFSAGLAFITIGLLMTVTIPIALVSAGNVDAGAVAAQYIATILLTGSFVSIGLFASSLTRSQVVPAIAALFIIAVLLIIGIPDFALRLPSAAARLLQDLSPLSHYLNMVRGVIDVRDVLYFLALMATFLSSTYLMVRGRTLSHRTGLYRNLQLGVAGFVIGSILVGWFGNSIGGRWDLTADKRFTLTPASSEILDQLDDLLVINLYLSRDPPVDIAATTREVRDFLSDFASKSDKVRFVQRFPKADDETDPVYQEAAMAGVFPKQFNLQTEGQLQIKTGWLGITITYLDQRRTIDFVDSMDGLEYRVAAFTSAMVREQRETIGFLAGHGEKVWAQEMQFVTGQLGGQYNLIDVRADAQGNLDLSGVDILVVAGPQRPFRESELAAMDAFFARGGKGLYLIDTTTVDPSTLRLRSLGQTLPVWLNRYGVFVHDSVLLDTVSNTNLSFTTAGGSVLLPYPYWVTVPVNDPNISGSVQTVMLPWGASLELSDPAVGLNVQTLYELIRTAGTTYVDFNYGDVSPKTDVSQYPLDSAVRGNHLVAVAVEGVAANAPPQDDGTQTLYRMVVIGDSEWLTDAAIQQSARESNIVLGLNWIDWLAQDESLSSIRSKVVVSRNLRWNDDAHKNLVQYGNILGLPLVLVVVGALRFIKRRNTGMKVFKREQ